MLSGGTLEVFEIDSRAGLMRKLERPHLERFERLKILVTSRTLNAYDIAGSCDGSDSKIERFRTARRDDDLFGRARGPLPKHEPRHLPAKPDVAARFLIYDRGVIESGEREPH